MATKKSVKKEKVLKLGKKMVEVTIDDVSTVEDVTQQVQEGFEEVIRPDVNPAGEPDSLLAEREVFTDSNLGTPEEIHPAIATVIKAAAVKKTREPKLPLEIYFGKGEFSVNSHNLDRLIKTLEDYKNEGIFKWSLSDVLGIKIDGSKAKKYTDILEALKNTENEKLKQLMQMMVEFVPRADIKRTIRSSSIEKEERRKEVEILLKAIEGLSDDEVKKMLKTI